MSGGALAVAIYTPKVWFIFIFISLYLYIIDIDVNKHIAVNLLSNIGSEASNDYLKQVAEFITSGKWKSTTPVEDESPQKKQPDSTPNTTPPTNAPQPIIPQFPGGFNRDQMMHEFTEFMKMKELAAASGKQSDPSRSVVNLDKWVPLISRTGIK